MVVVCEHKPNFCNWISVLLISRYGGAIEYVSSPRKLEVVKGMPPLRILVTNTKVPKNTKALVAGVRALRDTLPAVIDPILASIDAISHKFIDTVDTSVGAGDGAVLPAFVETVAQLVRVNQHLLCALGVGHPKLDEVCAVGYRCAAAR